MKREERERERERGYTNEKVDIVIQTRLV